MSTTLRLDGDVSGLDSALNHAKHRMHELRDVAKEGFSFGEALGAAVLIETVDKVVEHYQRLDQIAKRFNATAEATQRVQFVGDQNDVDIETITKGMTKLEAALQASAMGSEEAADKLEALGISGEKFRKLDLDEKLYALADAYTEAQDEGSGLSELLELVGKSGAELVPMLQQGGDALRELGKGAKTITQEDLENLGKFDNAIKEIKNTLMAFGGKHIGEFIGFLQDCTIYGTAAWEAVKGFFNAGDGEDRADAAGEAFDKVYEIAKELKKEEEEMATAEEQRIEHGREVLDNAEKERVHLEKVTELYELRVKLAKEISKTIYENLDAEGKYISKIQEIAEIQKKIDEAEKAGNTKLVLELQIEEEASQREAKKLGVIIEKETGKALTKAMKEADDKMEVMIKNLEDVIKNNLPTYDDFEKAGFGYGGVNYSVADDMAKIQGNLEDIKSTLEASKQIQENILSKDDTMETAGGGA